MKAILAIIFAAFPCLSYEIALPVLIPEMSLEIYSNQSRPLWFYYLHIDGELKEHPIEVNRGMNQIEIPKDVMDSKWSIIKYQGEAPHVILKHRGHRSQAPKSLSNSYHYHRTSGSVYISNFSHRENVATVKINGESQSLSLKPYETVQLRAKDSEVAVRTEYRSASLAISGKKVIWPRLANNPQTPKGSGFFVVGHPNDPKLSFVVKIEDEKLLKKARHLISNPDLNHKMMSASIESGSTYNVNYSSRHRYPWSWQVKEVYGFYDIGSQRCDGDPLIVEDDAKNWTENIRLICFWAFRVLKEL